jgi:hypothetical protein
MAVFGGAPAGHQNVVQIDENKRDVGEDVVHHSLERHTSVA